MMKIFTHHNHAAMCMCMCNQSRPTGR